MFGVPSFLPPGFEMYDRMAWFYKRNMSTTFDGYFNMFTGEDSLTKLGQCRREVRLHFHEARSV